MNQLMRKALTSKRARSGSALRQVAVATNKSQAPWE